MAAEVKNIAGNAYSNFTVSGSAKVHAGNNYNSYTFQASSILEPGTNDAIALPTTIAGLNGICTELVEHLSSYVERATLVLGCARQLLQYLTAIKWNLRDMRSLIRPDGDVDRRAPLVRVGHIVVSFTNAIVLLDEVNNVLSPLLLGPSGPDRTLAWTSQSEKLEFFARQLRWQSIAFELQIAVLKSASDRTAAEKSYILEGHINNGLAERQDLELRVDAIDALFAREFSTSGNAQSGQSSIFSRTSSILRRGKRQLDAHTERALNDSWVYSRNQHRTDTLSFCNSSARQVCLSALTGISMSKLSVLAIMGLPVVSAELSAPAWYEGDINLEENDKDELFAEGELIDWDGMRRWSAAHIGFIERPKTMPGAPTQLLAAREMYRSGRKTVQYLALFDATSGYYRWCDFEELENAVELLEAWKARWHHVNTLRDIGDTYGEQVKSQVMDIFNLSSC